MKLAYDTAEKRLAGAPRVVFYGAGLAALGVLTTHRLPVAYLVDDTLGAAGRRLPNGLEVSESGRLASEPKGGVFIVITAWTQNAVLKISDRLMALGFEPGYDFIDCSLLHFETIGEKLSARFGFRPCLDEFLTCWLWCLNSRDSSISAISGTFLFTQLLRCLHNKVPGAVAECGVYQGGNAFLSLMLSPELRQRPYFLFDSFEGFPELDGADPTTRKDHFRDASYARACARFASFENVQIQKGYFNATFPKLPETTFALVYVDCDLYESTLECLEYFWPRIAPGGALLMHDYWLPAEAESQALGLDLYQGVQKACREYFGSGESDRLIVFPETTHALLTMP